MMAKKPKPKGRPGRADPGLEREVHDALKRLGWVIPQSEDQVRAAEAEQAGRGAPLPASIADPAKVLGRRPGGAELKLSVFQPGPADQENLARAAREGGKIPPEIEERMRRDRQAAEEAFEREEHGEDVG